MYGCVYLLLAVRTSINTYRQQHRYWLGVYPGEYGIRCHKDGSGTPEHTAGLSEAMGGLEFGFRA